MITATPEDLSTAYSAALQSYFTLSRKTLEGVEKVVELNLGVLKTSLQDSAGKFQDLQDIKAPQDFLAVYAAQLQPSAERAVAYSRNLYGIAAETQAEFTQYAEAQLAESNQRMVSMIDSVSKNAPAGSETAVAMVKSAIAAANSAYDTMNKATKQAVEMAEANVTAATNAAVKTATQAAASAPRGKKAS